MKILTSALVISLAYYHSSLGAKLPSTFKRCKGYDSSCIKAAIQDCLPQLTREYREIGLRSYDPFQIPALVIGSGTGPVRVDQDLRNVKIFGIPTSEIQGVNFDWTEKVITLNLTIPSLRLEADYVLDGRVLLLPIRGKGKSVITLSDVAARVRMPFGFETKKGKEHLKFAGIEVKMDPAKMTFRFENLFDGDEQISEALHKVLNENWWDIYQDVRAGYENVIGKLVESTTSAVFSRVPIEEIFEK